MKMPNWANKVAPQQVKMAKSLESKAKAMAKKLMFDPRDPSTWSDQTKEKCNGS